MAYLLEFVEEKSRKGSSNECVPLPTSSQTMATLQVACPWGQLYRGGLTAVQAACWEILEHKMRSCYAETQ